MGNIPCLSLENLVAYHNPVMQNIFYEMDSKNHLRMFIKIDSSVKEKALILCYLAFKAIGVKVLSKGT